MVQLYLLGDVARLLGVKPHKVTYQYVTRKLEELPAPFRKPSYFHR